MTLKESAGDNAGALTLMEEVLTVRRKTLGDIHPDTLDSIINLALQHNEMGNFESALPLSLEAVASTREQLGSTNEHARRDLMLGRRAQLAQEFRAGEAAAAMSRPWPRGRRCLAKVILRR